MALANTTHGNPHILDAPVTQGDTSARYDVGYTVKWGAQIITYVYASAEITKGASVGLGDAWTVTELSGNANADTKFVGIAAFTSIASTGYGFIVRNGNVDTAVLVASSCAAGVPLYFTSTAGVLDDSGSYGATGVMTTEANTTATQALVDGFLKL